MSRDVRQPNTLDRYRSYDPPPAGFDPHTAPDEVLLRHGLPRRPDPEREPDLARIWKRAFAHPLTYVKAELAVDRERSGRDPLRSKGNPEFGPNNWAGAVVRAGQPFTWVFAEWVIPKVARKSVWADDFTVAFWAGIDGATIGNEQVLQAGVAVTMTTRWFLFPHVEIKWRAWTEWFPDHAVWVSNFPVKPGDTVTFLVCAPQPDSRAWVNILNVSTRQHTSVGVPTPEGYTSQGDSVEWIVETDPPNLPKFDPVDFNYCRAGKPNKVVDLTNGFEVNIYGAGGYLTEVQITPPNSAVVSRKGRA